MSDIEPGTYVIDTIVRRRCFVEAKSKRAAETLAKAIVSGSVQPIERQYDVKGSEIVAGVYHIDHLRDVEAGDVEAEDA